MMVLRRYGQGVEEDKDHHYPVKTPGFHIDKALHPEEAIPATSQAAKHKNNPGFLCQATVHNIRKHLHIHRTVDSLVVHDFTFAFQVVQAVCFRISTGQRQQA